MTTTTALWGREVIKQWDVSPPEALATAVSGFVGSLLQATRERRMRADVERIIADFERMSDGLVAYDEHLRALSKPDLNTWGPERLEQRACFISGDLVRLDYALTCLQDAAADAFEDRAREHFGDVLADDLHGVRLTATEAVGKGREGLLLVLDLLENELDGHAIRESEAEQGGDPPEPWEVRGLRSTGCECQS